MKYLKFFPVYKNNALSIKGYEKDQLGRARYLMNKGTIVKDDYLSLFDLKINQIGKEYDLLANNMSWEIVSERFVDACGEDIKQNIQFIEFPISAFYSQSINRYYLVNVLNLLDCVDLSQSQVAWSENDVGKKYISNFYKTVFYMEKIPLDTHIFRIQIYPWGLFISEHMQKRLRAAKITGYGVKTDF